MSPSVRGNRLYVNLGSATNSCQVQNRVAQSPGIFPCPELPVRAGVWLFDARGNNQTQASGEHYATGYRNLVSITVNPRNNDVYAVQQGRDMLFENWSQFFHRGTGLGASGRGDGAHRARQ
jgi:glucose/arabinose dehydrogenase